MSRLLNISQRYMRAGNDRSIPGTLVGTLSQLPQPPGMGVGQRMIEEVTGRKGKHEIH